MEQFLLFHLDRELFGLQIAHIQEIVESPVLHYIPRAPRHFIGAINFHGNVVPVVDLAELIMQVRRHVRADQTFVYEASGSVV